MEEITVQDAAFEIRLDTVPPLTSDTENQSIIGQPRALQALKMGLSIVSDGYNIFVSGEAGTGKKTAITLATREFLNDRKHLKDIVYVHNFNNPKVPVSITFPPGSGRAFSQDMEEFSAKCYNELAPLIKEGRLEMEDLTNIVQPLLSPLLSRWKEGKPHFFLAQIELDLTRHLYLFTRDDFSSRDLHSFLLRYSVNILVDHTHTQDRPLIFEDHPTFANLFGSLETTREESKEFSLPFLSIQSGSLLEAAGGYLVINAHEMFTVEGLYEALKRFLSTKALVIQNNAKSESSQSGIRPEPIELTVKVIIIGTPEVYEHLCEQDSEFTQLFKVSCEFDYSMPMNEENIQGTVQFLQRKAQCEHLLEVDISAFRELLRYSALIAENREELSTQLALLADLLREADYWAREHRETTITDLSVNRAIEAREYIGSLSEARIQNEIAKGEVNIALSGYKTGVVNGLAVIDLGTVSFGTPAVISATVAPGSEGIVNIEHEAGLSGEIHDKGLLILEGYLRKKYARTFPLSIYSGICFEQSYGEVDGDSASSSELYALLSAIGELPVRQNIAVTGSVNQMGELQPVGGINEKIIGFFRVCKTLKDVKHPTVIIPYQNVRNLILPSEVIDAIAAREFHIYPVRTIDEGMSVLTDRPSGERNQKGQFPVDSFNRVIENRLKHLYELSRPQS